MVTVSLHCMCMWFVHSEVHSCHCDLCLFYFGLYLSEEERAGYRIVHILLTESFDLILTMSSKYNLQETIFYS